MSIPLDQLYHYINQCAQQSWGDRVIIYRFYPHGSKDLKNLSFLIDYDHDKDIILNPQLYCNDQEPLDFDRYEKESCLNQQELEIVKSFNCFKSNLRDYSDNIWDYAILLHSEKRSQNLIQYEKSKFIPAYYWSHGMISRDWFRAAEYLQIKKCPAQHVFLIYNRAWAGTREYRLRFADLLIDLDLVKSCRMTVNSVDPDLGVHYHDYEFKNPVWQPQHKLEDYFPANEITSSYSAVFELNDYAITNIEVVLETLFDDNRLHLTEKILRPIACGQPFILAATHGSLEYLKDYGFQTYSAVWSEAYDQIQDPASRMKSIVSTMQQIQQWDPKIRQAKLQQANEIAEFNRQHFFSKRFSDLIESELQVNLDRAFLQLQQKSTNEHWLETKDQTWYMASMFKKSMLGRLSRSDWDCIVDHVKDLVSRRGH